MNIRLYATVVLLLAGVACFGYALVRARRAEAPVRGELRAWHGDTVPDDDGWRDPADTWIEELHAMPERTPWSAPRRTAYGDDDTWAADMARDIFRWRATLEADLRQFRREQCGLLPSRAESAI